VGAGSWRGSIAEKEGLKERDSGIDPSDGVFEMSTVSIIYSFAQMILFLCPFVHVEWKKWATPPERRPCR